MSKRKPTKYRVTLSRSFEPEELQDRHHFGVETSDTKWRGVEEIDLTADEMVSLLRKILWMKNDRLEEELAKKEVKNNG